MKVTKQYLKKLIKESLEEANIGSELSLETVFSQQAVELIQSAHQYLATNHMGLDANPDKQKALDLANYLTTAATVLKMSADQKTHSPQEADALMKKLNR